MREYRVQVYIRRKGKTISDGNEFKTEDYEDTDELAQEIVKFFLDVIYDLEESEDLSEGDE